MSRLAQSQETLRSGDNISIAGYVLTVSVVGAEIGVPLAALGNTVSTAGSVLEISVKVSQSDLKGASSELGWLATGELVDLAIGKIPGISNKQAKTIRENLSEHILKQGATVKLNAIEKATESNSENNKKK